ncbi:hypothetical protein DAI22_02g175950 [Oryza sativa Japonica Group]|nr:hypothetical protein DAI22_02g175950 [Oryza sativa Japonica Group]
MLCAAGSDDLMLPRQRVGPRFDSESFQERVESFHARRRSRMRMTTNENLPKALHGGHRERRTEKPM